VDTFTVTAWLCPPTLNYEIESTDRTDGARAPGEDTLMHGEEGFHGPSSYTLSATSWCACLGRGGWGGVPGKRPTVHRLVAIKQLLPAPGRHPVAVNRSSEKPR